MLSTAAGPVSPLTAQLRQFNLSFIGIRTGGAAPLFEGSLTALDPSAYTAGLESMQARLETFWEEWRAAGAEGQAGSALFQAATRLINELGEQSTLLEALQTRQQQLLDERVNEVNEILARLARLNTSPAASVSRQRKQARLINRLASLAGPLRVEEELSGPSAQQSIRIALWDTLLLQGSQHASLIFAGTEPAQDGSPFLVWKDAGPFQSGQGQIAGLLSLGEILLPSLQAGLDSTRAVLERALEDSRFSR